MKAVILRFVINLQKALVTPCFSSLGVAVRCDSPWQSDMALSCYENRKCEDLSDMPELGGISVWGKTFLRTPWYSFD